MGNASDAAGLAALGRRAFSWLLYPVVAVYWLTAHRARQASQNWLSACARSLAPVSNRCPRTSTAIAIFCALARRCSTKSPAGAANYASDAMWFSPRSGRRAQPHHAGGKLLLASHLGDVEACRALAQLQGGQVINALVFSDNARRFKQIMEEMAPQAGINLMPVTDIGPETAMLLKEKLERNEWWLSSATASP